MQKIQERYESSWLPTQVYLWKWIFLGNDNACMDIMEIILANCLEIVQKDCYLISLIVFNKKVLPKILSFNQNFLWWPMGHIWYKMFISHLITFAIWKKIKTETIHWFFHNLCFNLIFSFPGTDYRQVGTTADL